MFKQFLTVSACFYVILGALPAQQFQDQTAARLPVQAVWTEGVVAGDVDGDGDLDLVYAKGDGFSIAGTARQSTICINNGSGIFTDETAARFPVLLGHAKDAELVDVDGDGDLDVVLANAFNEQPRLWINNGAGVFTDGTVARFPSVLLNSFKVIAADIDNDGDLDLEFNNSGASTFGSPGGQPRIFVNNGAGFFTDETATRMPAGNVIAAVDANFADVDNDFDHDLLVVSRDQTTSKLYINNGSGFFSAGPVLPSDGNGTYEFGVGDLNNDSDCDIFVIGVSGTSDGVFSNNGAGTFTLSAGAIVGNPSSDDNAVALGDIDNDGDFDAAIAALSTAERILTNNGAGVFTYNNTLITALIDSSLDIKFADLDNDGDLDIVTSVGESGAFQNRVYMNVTGAPDTLAPTYRLQVHDNTTVAGDIIVRCGVKDVSVSDTDPYFQSVTLNYSINATPGSAPMKWVGSDIFRGVIPSAPPLATVTYSVAAVDRKGNASSSAPVVFTTAFPPPALSLVTTGVGDAAITITAAQYPNAEEYMFFSALIPPVLGSGPFFGIGADAFHIVFLPTGIPPVHDYLDVTGTQFTAIPPGTAPLGLTIDAVAVIVAFPVPAFTNVVRITF